MKSPINWAVLALVIERPSYAYELAQRFERSYRTVLSLSSTSQIYTALDALSSRSFVEELPGTRQGRQPRPCYKATEQGLERYESWLIEQVHEERRRHRLQVLQLAALKRHPDAGRILERYEQACRSEADFDPDPPVEDAAGEAGSECIVRLLSEESRLANEANLAWVGYARNELERRDC
jgi:DNA-binding PadR family transcriptional regulator